MTPLLFDSFIQSQTTLYSINHVAPGRDHRAPVVDLIYSCGNKSCCTWLLEKIIRKDYWTCISTWIGNVIPISDEWIPSAFGPDTMIGHPPSRPFFLYMIFPSSCVSVQLLCIRCVLDRVMNQYPQWTKLLHISCLTYLSHNVTNHVNEAKWRRENNSSSSFSFFSFTEVNVDYTVLCCGQNNDTVVDFTASLKASLSLCNPDLHQLGGRKPQLMSCSLTWCWGYQANTQDVKLLTS